MLLNTERTASRSDTSQLTTCNRLRAQRLQCRHQLRRSRRLQPATRRQKQVTHAVTIDQVPRQPPDQARPRRP